MNENYKGSIELISGLVQKNKGDFPLMEANAVAVYEQDGSEVRLDEKLRQLKEDASISEDTKTEIKESVFTDTRYTTLSGKVDGNSTAINAPQTGLIARMDAVEDKIDEGDNKELKIQFEEKESILYLFSGDTLIKPGGEQETNVISQTGITGGGAGATLNYSVSLKQLDASNLVFLNSDTPKIRYHAAFIDTSVAEGEDNLVSQLLNFKMTVTLPSGAKNVYTFTGDSNTDLEYDLTEILSTQSGLILGDHGITLTVSYTQEVGEGEDATPVTIQSTKKWTVKITQMYLESSFDDSAVRSGDVPFSVTVYGDLNKTIHYNFGGQEDWKTVEAPMSNYDYSITIPKQAHGNYPLEVYLIATVNNKEIRSNSLFFDIMFKEDGNNTPIIRAVPTSAKGQQYSNLAIEYSVYTPNSLISEVELAVDGQIVSILDSVDREEKVWNYKSSTEGMKTFTIKSGETVRTLNIEIEKIPYTIEPVTAGLELDFVPQGRTNQDADYNVFKNNAFDGEGNEIPVTWTLSDNFDWINGGWKTDEHGDSYFCVKAGTSVDINYLLFNDANTLVGSNKSKGNGKEFKIIFKTSNVANADTTWLSCLANPEIGSELGLQMDAHTAYVKTSSGTNLAIPYSEEDKIEFDMNIVPISYKDGAVDLTVQDIPMIMTYEDGTPVRPLVLTDDIITFKQYNAVPITIGSSYCDVHIYRMKAYSTYLSDKNILNNFIADASNAEEMIARYERNQIYDTKTGKLTPESFAAACPNMRVIKISAPRFTNDKKDKVLETEIEMIYKNGDPILDNWKAVYARHNGQGTSSNAYGYSGRNLELSLKEKQTLRYKITKPEGVYNEDGELLVFGTVVEGEQDFFSDEALENKIEDASTVTTITTIPGTTITLGDGSTTKKVSLTRDSVPTNYFNIKVNIASSEHANNALLQKRYDRYLPYTSYAEANDPNVKNNMNFYNCVIFVQERNEDLTTHQEFNDNEWHFYSMGNIGDSKKTDDSRANDPDDTKEFCVEIMDWNRELSAFPQDTKVQANADKYTIKDKDSNITGYIFITEENLQAGKLFERDYSLTQYQEQDTEGTWISYGYKVSTDEALETGWVVTNENGIYTESGEHFTSGQIYEEKYLNQKFYSSADVDTREEVSINSNILLRASKYYIDILEQDDYSEDYTYGFRYLNDDEDAEQIATAKAKWNEFYRFITRDNYYEDRRANESGKWLEDPEKISTWKSEFENWFIKDAAFYYYLFTLRYTMVDNRAKNSFWHWGKCLDGRYRMDFWDYDNDTALGIDNTGKFTMSYGVEDHDVNEGGAAHFRAHNSTFFVRVADYFAEELITYYTTLENKDNTVFNSTSLINEFDSWQSEFPEELWRVDYERKYKRTYVGGYGTTWDNAVNPAQIKKAADPQFLTEMMNGKKKYQRRQFERNQDVYMSSKFFGLTNSQDMLTLRGGGDMDPSLYVVKPNGDITITPYLNMYVNAGPENNKFLHHVKVKAGESVTLKYPTSALEFNYIWGGSYLQSLGDLSPMYLRVAKLGQGQRLKQLILGNATEGYNNPNLENVEITANNKLLEELNVRNMSTLTGAIPITNIASLRKLYAQGTNYQTVQFANSGLIEEAFLPASIHTIIANNLYYLHTLELEDATKLEKLLINNCPKLKEVNEDSVQKDLALVSAATNLKRVRLIDLNWNLPNASILNRLVDCAGIGDDNYTEIDQSVLTGTITLASVRQSELNKFAAAWPELELIYNEEDVIPEWTITFWREQGDEQPIYSFLCDELTTLTAAHNPAEKLIAEGLLVKESTPQFDYKFKTWSPTFEGSLVTTNLDFYGTYTEITRKYEVAWYNDKNGTLITDTEGNKAVMMVEYGKPAVYNEAQFGIPQKNTAAADNRYHLFNGWDTPTGYITGNTKVAPIWESSTANVPVGTASTELTPAQINALSKVNLENGLSKFIADGGEIKIQTGYMPDYGGIVLIDSPVTFDGTGSNVIQTEYKLFDEDKSFVLAVDFEAHMSKGDTYNTLVSCGGAAQGRGFRLSSYQDGYPTVQWNQQNSVQVGFNSLSALHPRRDICVIKHTKGDNNLYVYTNNRKSFDTIKLTSLPGTSSSSLSHSLCFGGQSTVTGVSTTNYGTGIVHYAKLWLTDLDDAECKRICSWIYDELTFSNCGTRIYATPLEEGSEVYEGESYRAMSFVAEELLDLDMVYDDNAGDNQFKGGWSVSSLREWLNTKLFAGLSLPWQQIIQPVALKSLYGYTTAGTNNKPSMNQRIVTTKDNIYIPARAEVDSTASGYYALEKSSKMYSVFSDKKDRIKYYPTEEKDAWWIRTPGDYSYPAQEIVYPNGSIGTYYTDPDTGDYYSGSRADTHGVLIAFSIGEVI